MKDELTDHGFESESITGDELGEERSVYEKADALGGVPFFCRIAISRFSAELQKVNQFS